MKKIIKRFFSIILLCCACLIAIPFNLIININMIWHIQEYKYYIEKTNFVEVTAKITDITWHDYNKVLCIVFDELPEGFSTNDLYIEDENYDILLDNNACKDLEPGDTVTFITAPRYFGNGYMVPIIEIRKDNQTYLEYEQGYINLILPYIQYLTKKTNMFVNMSVLIVN